MNRRMAKLQITKIFTYSIMFNYILLISAILFVTLDSIYLNLAKSYFKNQVTLVQGSAVKMDLLAAILCYIFLIVGLNYFIIQPRRSVVDAFFFGLIIYAVFETTNKSLFSNWSWLTVIMDSLWGGVLFAITTYLISKIRKMI
jgi:uncharacterized membrane protein